jgi:predicted nucleotidyltransferase
MVDRLEMARQYVQEMLEQRDDIVGAFVVGSVARGDATETSNIDLGLIIDGLKSDEILRGGVDAWRDGVYIELGLEPKDHYDDAERVLQNPFAATHMKDALILHDPTGLFARVQGEVRTRFMEPRWLRLRVDDQVGMLHMCLLALHESVADGNAAGVCYAGTGFSMWIAFVPLIASGVTPSSTKSLPQLDNYPGELRKRIYAWEGSDGMSRDDLLRLVPTVSRPLSLPISPQWGRMGEYFQAKARWMAEHGMHRDAVHLMWMVVSVTGGVFHNSEDPETRRIAEVYAQSWLHAVGWEGQEVIEEKVRLAEEMVAEVEAMAAHLPSDEDLGAE